MSGSANQTGNRRPRSAPAPTAAHALPAYPLQIKMDPAAFEITPACQAEMKATRMKKRVHEILSKALAEPREG